MKKKGLSKIIISTIFFGVRKYLVAAYIKKFFIHKQKGENDLKKN